MIAFKNSSSTTTDNNNYISNTTSYILTVECNHKLPTNTIINMCNASPIFRSSLLDSDGLAWANSLTHVHPMLYMHCCYFHFHILIQCDRFDGNEFGGQHNLLSSQLPLLRRKTQKVIDFVTSIYLKRVLPCIHFNGLDWKFYNMWLNTKASDKILIKSTTTVTCYSCACWRGSTLNTTKLHTFLDMREGTWLGYYPTKKCISSTFHWIQQYHHTHTIMQMTT